ncbi:MAG: 2Fe-2S iron-sulfur cluster-binding protein [Marinilabiliales bacterium]|nr:2Fe-2S iron-sulfur cluster-binding protein [Marinilabiliales bacterium]
MQFTIEVNNKSIKAEKGETILSALNRNGIMIPTLCRMAGVHAYRRLPHVRCGGGGPRQACHCLLGSPLRSG